MARSIIATPEVRYAKSGAISVAYQTLGQGDLDIVVGLPFVSHPGVYWDLPGVAAFFRGLAAISPVMIFDKRGVGLFDRDVGIPTLEERMDGIRAVMDVRGSPRTVLLGFSDSAPLSILFAARHPERTTGPTLIGGYARELKAPDYPCGATKEVHEAGISEMEPKWGTPTFMQQFSAGLEPAGARMPDSSPG